VSGRRLRLLVATGGGLGRAGLAPGTVASAAALLLVLLLWEIGGAWALALGTAGAILAGAWSASAAEEHFARKDPPAVVADEIAGQMASLLFFPPTAANLLVGFALFRVLDILKPFPARRLEALPGAAGIMADDLVAAGYANLLQRVLHEVVARGWFDA
jgi:phosphatidylglycerophosphatase A